MGPLARCERCEGTGRTYCSDRSYCGRRCCTCDTCNGTGKIEVVPVERLLEVEADIERDASREPPQHMCLTTELQWVPCPPDLCEAGRLDRERVRLRRELAGAVEEREVFSRALTLACKRFRDPHAFKDDCLRRAGEELDRTGIARR